MQVNGWVRAQVLSGAVVLVSILAVLWKAATERSWWTFGFAMTGFVSAIAGWIQIRKIGKGDENRENPWSIMVDTINRNRHDMMNDLQVLYGYVSLQKYDKLREFMDTIKLKAARESRIARIGPPELAAFLFSFEIRYRYIRLDFEIDSTVSPEHRQWIADARIADAIRKAADCFAMHVGTGNTGPNRLSLRIQEEPEEGKMRVLVEFVGNYVWPRFSADLENILSAYCWRWTDVKISGDDAVQLPNGLRSGIAIEFPVHT